MTALSQRRIFKRLIAIAVFVALAAAVVPLSHTTAWHQATTAAPDPYTELYFSQPELLPPTVQPGSTLTPHFVIHNLEGRSLTYQYELRLAGDTPNTPPTVRQGSIALPAGASRTVAAPLTTPSFTTRAKLSISIQPTNQTIHYWVGRTGHGQAN